MTAITDGDLFMVYNSLNAALDDNVRAFRNLLRWRSANNELLSPVDGSPIDVSAVPDDDLLPVDYAEVPKLNGQPRLDGIGLGTSFGEVRQRADNKYVFPKPIAALMTGLSPSSIQAYDPETWFV
jgi:hypothetical protein